jgi:tetratricopeptide (TPR) repeat protein
LYRLAAVVLGPALALGLLECSLRVAGYGYSTNFFVDGSAIEGRPVWIENRHFSRWVFPRQMDQPPQPVPFVLPKVKAEKTCRIFVMGESAAMGFPDPSTSFARVLEVMLRARYPGTHFEVVNTSMVAINSHVVRQIARECADRQPDLFIVHLGNNEVVGPFGAAGVLGPFSPDLRLIRTNLAIKSTRSGQLLNRAVESVARKDQTQQAWTGMGSFLNSQIRADDSRMPRIYSHFRSNLEDICRAGREAGVPVVLCTIPVNLKDCAPFGSLHPADFDGDRAAAWEKSFQAGASLEAAKNYAEAARSYQEADRIDEGYAELPYRLGRCFLALGDAGQAQRQFARARDLDVLRFRTDTRINEIIREVAAVNAAGGARLADAEREFAKSSPGGVPGDEFFLEHVHMNFQGHWLLGRVLFDTITDPATAALGSPSGGSAGALSETQCARFLAQTEWGELRFGSDMYERLIQAPPFTLQCDHRERCQRWEARLAGLQSRLKEGGIRKVVAEYEAAVQANPDDWMIRANFAKLLTDCGRLPAAQQQCQEVLARCRHYWDAYRMIGSLDLTMNNPEAAESEFRKGLKLDPENSAFALGLSEALERQWKNAEAQTVLEAELKKDRNSVATLRALGRFLYRTGKLEEAKARLAEAQQRDPKSPDLHVDLGVIELQQQNVDAAIERFEAALQLRPHWPEIRQQLDELKKGRPAVRTGNPR